MKPGDVVRIRLSTTDCMAIADIIDLIGIKPESMSVSGAASMAMSAAFEDLRRIGKIPYRQGFEYTTLLEPFKDNSNTKQKRGMTEQLQADAAKGLVPSLNGMTYLPGAGPDTPAVVVVKKALPEGYDNWTPEQMIAYQVAQLDAQDAEVAAPTNLG